LLTAENRILKKDRIFLRLRERRGHQPTKEQFHGGVWLKSGARKSLPGSWSNVRQVLRPGNNRGMAATMVTDDWYVANELITAPASRP
jgi:hypothetical protein